MDTDSATDAVREVADHPVVERGARLGYAASGVVHLLIAWLGVQLVTGTGAANADQSGALALLAGSAGGTALLGAMTAGFALLGLWHATEALLRKQTGTRLKAAGKFLLYAALAWSAAAFLRGAGTSSEQQSVDVTARLMEQPWGRALVALVGLAVVGGGAYHVVTGWRRGFLKDLSEHPGPWAVRAGRFGYIAKGIALALVGMLFLTAAVTQRASEATGLDGALHRLLQLPYGSILLAVVVAGFAAFGVYCFARARYAKV